MTQTVKKILHLGAGWLCLGLALIGAMLPLLPTTVFLILAAFFFAKGSPRLRLWLLNHQSFGPAIQDWEKSGAIAPRYKKIATLMMALSFGLSLALGLPLYVLVLQALCLCAAAAYVLSRPSS